MLQRAVDDGAPQLGQRGNADQLADPVLAGDDDLIAVLVEPDALRVVPGLGAGLGHQPPVVAGHLVDVDTAGLQAVEGLLGEHAGGGAAQPLVGDGLVGVPGTREVDVVLPHRLVVTGQHRRDQADALRVRLDAGLGRIRLGDLDQRLGQALLRDVDDVEEPRLVVEVETEHEQDGDPRVVLRVVLVRPLDPQEAVLSVHDGHNGVGEDLADGLELALVQQADEGLDVLSPLEAHVDDDRRRLGPRGLGLEALPEEPGDAGDPGVIGVALVPVLVLRSGVRVGLVEVADEKQPAHALRGHVADGLAVLVQERHDLRVPDGGGAVDGAAGGHGGLLPEPDGSRCHRAPDGCRPAGGLPQTPTTVTARSRICKSL